MQAGKARPYSEQTGFTYIGVLILVAILGIGLTGTATVVSTAAQRDREQELLFIGTAYVNALERYRRVSPGAPQYPVKLEELLADPRFPQVQRHLRRLYADPITRSNDWGLLRGPNNGIVGLYSKSDQEPLKKAGFPRRFDHFTGATRYSDWRFIVRALEDEGD